MFNFLFEVFRGIIVGLLVGYLLRPEAKLYRDLEQKVGDAVASGGEVVEESFFDFLIHYAPEYLLLDLHTLALLLAGGVGALVGLILWYFRRKKRKAAIQEKTTRPKRTPAKRKTSAKRQTKP